MKLKDKKQQGIVKRHPDGFGFFVADDPEHPDVYIPRQDMRGVMTNDRVEIEVYPDKKFSGEQRWRGEIIKILERKTTQVVGCFHRLNDHDGAIMDESHSWGENMAIPLRNSMDAKEGEIVGAKITHYPDGDHRFEGRVVRIIGDGNNPINDIIRVAYASGIPQEFSKKVEKEISHLTEEVEPKELEGREDLQELKFITIDGVTAKDFDDAVYVENNEKGFRLWVAIADVSHYVKPNTQLDDEAYDRGTSTYFPNFVFPMLPEVLSNGLCSLNPHKPRLALVCDMQMDFNGELLSHRFLEAVIQSHQRVTYGEAQEVIDGNEVEKLNDVKDVILRAADLAKILMAKRFKEGSLDLEIPETEVMVNEAGEPVDIIRSERLFAHRLIEEMMLVANISAAKFLSNKEIPAMYRIHEPPDEDAIHILERYLHNFGARRGLRGGKLQKKISRALQDFSGKPEEQILNILTLRSMSQAKYSEQNVGHFGLGFEFYSHFTSPIRRYPDLIVHRLIKSQIGIEGYQVMSEDNLASAGTFLSACEQRSVKAERQVVSIKKARFMQGFVGETYEGVVSSVMKFGLFVLLRQFDVDGRVAIEALGNDKWEYDDENLCLRGKRTGRVYKIGDKLSVVVAQVDVEEGKIDFHIEGEEVLETSEQRKTDRNHPKERGKGAKNRGRSGKARVSKRRRKT